MKNSVLCISLFIIALAAFETTSFAQKKICTCEKVGGRTCEAKVECTNGCSAICGKKDTCSVSCSKRVYRKTLNLDLVQKSAEDIAKTLASESGLRLKFEPNTGEKGKYDYELINSDVWRLLEFLDAHGTLLVNGIKFDNLRDIKNQLKAGGKLASVTFDNIPVEEAMERLELMTGEDLRIVSGNPEKRISVSVTDVSLAEVLEAIRKNSDVRVEVNP